ncbi:TPA: hypothetical protein VBX43_000906 [Streptococcus agalactiae]|nr:hypothetical protein [Streptococcus agalactiae]
MTTRKHVYLDDEKIKKLDEIVDYLSKSKGKIINKHRNKSETMGILIETFHQLFVQLGEGRLYYDRLFQLENQSIRTDDSILLKAMQRQLDQLLYLELTNFHAITKGNHFDIQDLESIHSRFDPSQYELMARIDDLIKEDVARGQTMKNSH